jgi:hypothetical protein
VLCKSLEFAGKFHLDICELKLKHSWPAASGHPASSLNSFFAGEFAGESPGG